MNELLQPLLRTHTQTHTKKNKKTTTHTHTKTKQTTMLTTVNCIFAAINFRVLPMESHFIAIFFRVSFSSLIKYDGHTKLSRVLIFAKNFASRIFPREIKYVYTPTKTKHNVLD